MLRRFALVTAVCAAVGLTAYAAGPTFRPDFVFKGSALTGWQPLGQADWRAENGEIVGTPNDPSGGWLMLDQSFQDVALFTNVQCTGGCKAGVLLRAEKTANGMKGVFVSLTEGDLATYAVTLDPQGKELQRASAVPAPRGGGAGAGRAAQPVLAPVPASLPTLASRPTGTYKPGEWNAVDITLAQSSVTTRINGGTLGAAAGNVEPEMGNYGPIALYVGGTAPARFEDLAYADLIARPFPKEEVSSNYRVQRLDSFYYSYTAAVADVTNDGNPDVIAGPYYYPGPDFTVGRQFYAGITYNPTSEWPMAAMVSVAHDFSGDGWPDVLQMSGNAGNGTGTLYVNPKGESRRWDTHVVIQPIGNETTIVKDIDGDGQPEVIHSGNSALQYSEPDPANPTGRWITKTISEPGLWGANIGHGMGIGDINGDGRMDYVNSYGWWEQPPSGSSQALWTHHPVAFARWGASQGGAGGGEMGIYDVNGDGLNDVVTALEGHGFGLAWHEQKREGGNITFVEHTIMDGFLDENAGGVTFTQPHAVTFADMDGDGLQDMVVGKRHHSHFQYGDPDNWGAPVLYVYRAVRNANAPGGAEFVPELVHNRSGVGSAFAVADLNKDGTPDIATSNASGTFVFFNRPR
jgi:hypothetical protein